MKPKEKAKELLIKFLYYVESFSFEQQNENAKQCALISVDEILELNVCWYDEDLVKSYPKSYKPSQTIEFWEQVKEEIENL